MRCWVILILTALVSCKDIEVTSEDTYIKMDTLSVSLVGADKDKNGCLATAGYTWSVLKQDCIRLFEIAFVLTPIQLPETTDAVLVTYVLISSDGLKAEVFFPGSEESILMNRPVVGQPWIHEDWKLIADEGFKLYREGSLEYLGDNEPGPKIIGSDKLEN
jgi:hypothetical protein